MTIVYPEHEHTYGLYGPGDIERCAICGQEKPGPLSDAGMEHPE